MCAPSPNLHLPSRQGSFVLRKAVPRLLLQWSFRTIFWTQKMPFPRKKKTPLIHHGQAAQRPQHVCLTQTLRDPSTEPAKIAMTTNGRGLSQPPPFELRGLSAYYSPHSPSRLAPMMIRLRISATMSSYSGRPPRFSPTRHFHHLRWI